MANRRKDNPQPAGKFRKDIGLFGGVSLVAGMVIGSGVYYLGAYVLDRTAMNIGLALICWIIGGLVSILGGLCFAELGASMPVAGGQTVYLSRAYKPVLGFINGFNLFLINGSGSTAALAIAGATAFSGIVSMGDLTIKIIAVVLIVIFTITNLLGVKGASYFQNFTMAFRLLPLALIIIFGLTMGKETPDLSLGSAFEGTSGLSGAVSLIAFATFATLWAYEGWANMNGVAEELKNPKRNLPLAIIISLGGITLLYTIFNFAIYKVLPADQMATMISEENLYMGSEAAKRLLGNFGYSLVLAGMLVGVIGTLNGGILVFPRTYYAMAKEGYFPKSFAKLNSKGVPANAIIASSIVAVILVFLRNLDQLTGLVIFVQAILNMLTVIAVPICRKKYPDIERPYKVWGGMPTIIITVILFAVLLINQLITDTANSLIGLVSLVIGVVVYLYFKKKNAGVVYSGEERNE
jgi:APA family basic amino acid/polyamine antiporter